jgi:hypothetical protein
MLSRTAGLLLVASATATGCMPSGTAPKNFVPSPAGPQKLAVLHVTVMVDERPVESWKPLGNRLTLTIERESGETVGANMTKSGYIGLQLPPGHYRVRGIDRLYIGESQLSETKFAKPLVFEILPDDEVVYAGWVMFNIQSRYNSPMISLAYDLSENCFGFDTPRLKPSFPAIPWATTKLRNAATAAERVCAQDQAGVR